MYKDIIPAKINKVGYSVGKNSIMHLYLEETQMSKEKVITYYRKSIKPGKKTKEESVEYQRSKIAEYAKDNGFEIIKEFLDVGVSGTLTNRPDFAELLLYLEGTPDKINQIIFYSIDRLGRDTLVNIELIALVIEKIGKASFIKEGISTISENFEMIFLIYSSMAQDGRDNLLDRLRDGRKSKVLVHKNFDGNYPPLGLKKERDRLVRINDEITNSQLINQETEIVQHIFVSYLTGNRSLRQIAKDLNESYGFTRRNKPWNYKSVKYILQNEVYIGVLSGVLEKTERYYVKDANVDCLIDKTVFFLVQQKLKYENAGRKKKDSVELPPIILCRFCGNILQKLNANVFCSICNVESKVQDVKETVFNGLKNYVDKFETIKFFTEIKNKLILQYQIKLWKLETYLKGVLERKEGIRRLEVTNDIRDRMMQNNTKLMVNIFKEKELIQIIIYFFKMLTEEEVYHELSERSYKNLIELPFLTLIDLVDKKIDFLFLRKSFSERNISQT